MEPMLETLKTFTGLAHRCQWVREREGVAYYDDSKATNVGAALAAIEGLGADIDGKLVLIAGGDGKGADFSGMREPVAGFCRAVVLLGRDAELIAQALGDAVPLVRVRTLDEAVSRAAELAVRGRRAAVARVRQPRHVQELRRARTPLRPGRGGAHLMLARLFALQSPLRSRRGLDMDFPLLAGCLALLGLGLVMITSASSEVAAALSGNPLYHSIRHLIYLAIGGVACVLTLQVPMSFWQRYGARLMLVAFVLLIMVLLPGIGREVNGAKRWIGFGLFNLQPSELAKLFTVMFIAGYLVRRQDEVREKLTGFIKPMLVLGPIAVLLLAEPDFGATVVLVGSCIAMLFLGGINLVRFVPLVGAVLGAGVLVMTSQSYRMQRLTNFIDPWADQYGAGYQLSQALIAFGRGEWFGVGLGNSIQKQFYLPEAHTDFVFAVLAEELGMVGALATVALFVFVSVRALHIGLCAERARILGLRGLWPGIPVDRPGPDQHRCERRPAAHQGPDPAVPQLRRQLLVICCVCLGLLLRIEWESRTHLGNEDIEFVESDFLEEEVRP